jgi:hypothetical protein
MIRSSKAIQASVLATVNNKEQREKDRSKIILDLVHDLQYCALHALGYHKTKINGKEEYHCRLEMCPRPEEIPPELHEDFHNSVGLKNPSDISLETSIEEFCVNRPVIAKKSVMIKNYAKRYLEDNETLCGSNIINHVFGDHEKCPSGYCTKRKLGALQENTLSTLKIIMMFMVAKSDRLVEYLNSNIAETFAAQINMICGGRRVNLVTSINFARQCILGALNMDLGYSWHYEAQLEMRLRPSNVVKTYAEKIAKQRKQANDRHRPP